MEYEQLEECVHEEDPVRLDGAGVEEDRLGGPVEGVRVQDGLQRLGFFEILIELDNQCITS